MLSGLMYNFSILNSQRQINCRWLLACADKFFIHVSTCTPCPGLALLDSGQGFSFSEFAVNEQRKFIPSITFLSLNALGIQCDSLALPNLIECAPRKIAGRGGVENIHRSTREVFQW